MALSGRRLPQAPAVAPMPEPALAAALPVPAGAVHGAVAHHHEHAATSTSHGHAHGHDHAHDHGSSRAAGHTHGPAAGRGGLIGMGVAGGLVPSPSALIVLLASIGLGRTVFGVVLVLAYGVGMAATLTAVGLLLVRLRGRLDRRGIQPRGARCSPGSRRAVPVLTAGLVLLVGLALVARGVVLGV